MHPTIFFTHLFPSFGSSLNPVYPQVKQESVFGFNSQTVHPKIFLTHLDPSTKSAIKLVSVTTPHVLHFVDKVASHSVQS